MNQLENQFFLMPFYDFIVAVEDLDTVKKFLTWKNTQN